MSSFAPSASMPAQPPRVGRIIRSCKWYFLQLPTLFTSTVNETQLNATENADWDLWIRGATTELSLLNLIQFNDISKHYLFSSKPVPFSNYAGQTYKNEIYRLWKRPYSLLRKQVLSATMKNLQGNANGNLMFFTERADSYLYHVIEKDCAEYQLAYSFPCQGVANFGPNEVVGPLGNDPADFDVLIMGANYTGQVGTNTFQFVDESVKYPWSANPLRCEYFTGMIDQPQDILWYPTPYYLGSTYKILATLTNTNAQSVGTFYLTFNCLKGFRTFQKLADAEAYAKKLR